MKTKYFIAIIAVLVSMNFAFLYQNLMLKGRYEALKSKQLFQLQTAPNFVLNDVHGVSYELEKLFIDSRLVLLVFFSPMDCAPCLDERDLWNRISREGKIKVVGVARHKYLKELRDWIENSDIGFPVLNDAESRATRQFGIRKTPFKILVDDKRNILIADPVRITSFEQEEFIKTLDEIIRNY